MKQETPTIDDLMKQIISCRHDNAKAEISYCMKLALLSRNDTNSYAYCFSMVYLSDAYYGCQIMEKALKAGLKAYEFLKDSQFEDLLLVTCNLLGVIYTNISDEQSAMEYYFKALNMARSSKNHMMCSAIYSNLAHLYEEQGAYERALANVEDAYHYSNLANDNEQNINYSRYNYDVDRAHIRFLQGDYTQSLSLINQVLTAPDLSRSLYAESLLLKGKLLFHLNQKDQLNEILPKLLSFFLEYKDPLIKAKQNMRYLDLCLLASITDHLDDILKETKGLLGNASLPNKWIEYYDLMMRYSTLIQDTKQMNYAAEQYYYWSKKQDSFLSQSKLARIKNRSALFDVLKKKEQLNKLGTYLENKAAHDELTHINNRYGLNQYLKQSFDFASREHIPFGVILIDVDYFKEYNDFYGHLKGDDCLIAVSSIIRQVIVNNGFIARYGGDEFIVICLDKTKKELTEFASGIKNRIQELALENIRSKSSNIVTVTMGITLNIPGQSDDVLDYIYAADNALYRIKKQTRNDFCFYEDQLA